MGFRYYLAIQTPGHASGVGGRATTRVSTPMFFACLCLSGLMACSTPQSTSITNSISTGPTKIVSTETDRAAASGKAMKSTKASGERAPAAVESGGDTTSAAWLSDGVATVSPAVVPATGLIAPTPDRQGFDRIQLADTSGSPMIMTAQNTVAEEGMSLEKAAQKANNPVSDAWLLITQNDLTSLDTPDGSEWRNRTSIQPVMPVPILDGEWNIVNRIVTGVVSAPIDDDLNSTDPFDGRTTGLTDTVYFALAAPNRDDGWIWGLGPTFILPTATEDVLGQEKWQAGPAGLLVRLGNDYGGFGLEHFNIGVLAQHWWDFAGDDDRASVSQSDIQYFVNWKATPTQLIGMTPNIQIDWNKSGSDRFSVPIGLGTIGLFRMGNVPIRWGIEAQYYVMQPDPVGPEFNLKLFFAPIIGNPFK